jgi:hypothetical protein
VTVKVGQCWVPSNDLRYFALFNGCDLVHTEWKLTQTSSSQFVREVVLFKFISEGKANDFLEIYVEISSASIETLLQNPK